MKTAALDFLQLVVSGRIREAYEKHTGPEFRHHNPHYRGDAQSLMIGMEESDKQFPRKEFEIQRALQEGDIVCVHSRVVLNPGGPTVAVVHIFRFENEKIAELWDIGQIIPETMTNEHGMF